MGTEPVTMIVLQNPLQNVTRVGAKNGPEEVRPAGRSGNTSDSTAKRSGGKRKNLIYSAHVQKKHETPTTRIDQRRQ